MPKIGPTFPAELVAAGIPLDGITWDADAGAILSCPDVERVAVNAVLAAHDPTKPLGPPTITGNQWAFALGDLALAAAWRAGVAKSKDKDQIRWSLIARDTPLLATDPLLIRIAANADVGKDASDPTWIDVPTVFKKAQTEPT